VIEMAKWNFGYGITNDTLNLAGWDKEVKGIRNILKKLRTTQPEYQWRSKIMNGYGKSRYVEYKKK